MTHVNQQVEQSGMRVPWALEVFDFAGRRHDVTLQPGEMVFYEVRRQSQSDE